MTNTRGSLQRIGRKQMSGLMVQKGRREGHWGASLGLYSDLDAVWLEWVEEEEPRQALPMALVVTSW